MLKFVDDTIPICDGLWSNLWYVKSMLRVFELASGLCVNLNKSKLYGVHLDDSLKQAASTFLACEI